MSAFALSRPAEVLLVEDNPGDIRLTKEVLDGAKILNHLTIVGDGVEAMTFLHREGRYVTAPRPDLILLDLNLPRKNGGEVLAEVKADANLHRIPIVILTISRAEEDIQHSYDQYANCYVTKPVDLEQFQSVVEAIEDFWLAVVHLPPME